MAMKTVIVNPARVGAPAGAPASVAVWTAEDQARLDQSRAETRKLEERAAQEATKLEPTPIEAVQQMVNAAYSQERASIIAFFPMLPGGGRVVLMQTEDDLNFALKSRKPQRFALFRVTEGKVRADGSRSNPFRIGAAFIVNLFGKLESKEFRDEVGDRTVKPAPVKPV